MHTQACTHQIDNSYQVFNYEDVSQFKLVFTDLICFSNFTGRISILYCLSTDIE